MFAWQRHQLQSPNISAGVAKERWQSSLEYIPGAAPRGTGILPESPSIVGGVVLDAISIGSVWLRDLEAVSARSSATSSWSMRRRGSINNDTKEEESSRTARGALSVVGLAVCWLREQIS